MIDNGDEFYSPKEAAKRLGLTNHETLAVWRSKKKHPDLKYVRIGGCIRYLKRHVDEFIKKNTVGE